MSQSVLCLSVSTLATRLTAVSPLHSPSSLFPDTAPRRLYFISPSSSKDERETSPPPSYLHTRPFPRRRRWAHYLLRTRPDGQSQSQRKKSSIVSRLVLSHSSAVAVAVDELNANLHPTQQRFHPKPKSSLE